MASRSRLRHAVGAVRHRVPWLAPPDNHESPLPYVASRPTVNPILPVSDMAAAIEFYRSIGFAVDAYDAGYAWVRTCGWEFFHLARSDALPPGGSRAAAYLHVDDPDAWHAAMNANAPTVEIGPLVDQPWGMREFSLDDPDGNRLRIGRNL